MQEEDGNVGALNASALHVLREHCEISFDKQKASRKSGKKIAPGQRIVSLDTEDNPGSSKEKTNLSLKKRKT